jgi:O-antigen ligase
MLSEEVRGLSEAKITLHRHAQAGWFASERIAPAAALAWLSAFALMVAALGGSSRPDPVQIALLRPLATLFLIPALYLMDARSWREVPVLVALFATFALWMGLQLVPLPPALWQGLPDREIIAKLDQLTGLGGQWRPLSLAPTRGMNALISLIVPLSALLLALACRTTSQLILHVILAIGLLNAALGFVQLATGPNSPLYLYMYVAPRSAAGLFANENHSAVFSVMMVLIIARLTAESHLTDTPSLAWTRIAYPTAFLILLLTVLVTGSRAGFSALTFALAACGLMAFRLADSRTAYGPNDAIHKARRWQGSQGLAVVFAGLVAALIAVFAFLERSPALQDILGKGAFDDLRWQILPIVKDMLGRHWLWGSGFGSFDMLYQTYEPTDLLMVTYVNHAHNDWLQIALEGGLPARLIAGGLLIWVLLALAALRHGRGARERAVKLIFWIAVVVVIGAASAVDYPLRTPIYQAVSVWLLVCLALDRKNSRWPA